MNNYIDEFRDKRIAEGLANILTSYDGKPVTLMEVCGTHTMAIFRFGIRELLPSKIRLVSGPGCPVCVTPTSYIDAAVRISRNKDVITTTFGDMMRVPGSDSSLLNEKADGNDVRIVYSPLDSLKIASDNPDKQVVFLSVGFETTIPVSALAVIKARENKLTNFSLLSANKTIPEALKLLAGDKSIGVDGFIYPGHVSAIIGTGIYRELAANYGIPGVVAGFEPLDILHAIITLVNNINEGKAGMVNEYSRVVKRYGNTLALEKADMVFEKCDASWRGLGIIPNSGLKIREEYSSFDAWKVFNLEQVEGIEPEGCLCGEVLKGKRVPPECALFGTLCSPENPVGACMVSSEGTCAAYYKYGKRDGTV